MPDATPTDPPRPSLGRTLRARLEALFTPGDDAARREAARIIENYLRIQAREHDLVLPGPTLLPLTPGDPVEICGVPCTRADLARTSYLPGVLLARLRALQRAVDLEPTPAVALTAMTPDQVHALLAPLRRQFAQVAPEERPAVAAALAAELTERYIRVEVAPGRFVSLLVEILFRAAANPDPEVLADDPPAGPDPAP